MLEIILVWAYIFITSFAIGSILIHLLQLNINSEYEVVSLIGLSCLTVLTGAVSIFMPLGVWWLHLFLIIFVLIWWLRFKGSFFGNWVKGLGKYHLFFAISFFIYVLYKSAGPITNPDTGSYHLPLIKWFEAYPMVKGLANVHSRFAFNYQYFNLAALYGFSFLKGSTMHAMNGFVYLLLGVHLLKRVKESYKDGNANVIMFGIALFFFTNMSHAASSFSPDVPSSALACVALITYMRSDINDRDKTILVFILSMGAFLFKISYFSLLLLNLTGLILLLKEKKFGHIAIFIASGVLALLPFFIRNYFIAGYLMYPFYQIDLFDVDWKMPKEAIMYDNQALVDTLLGSKDISSWDFWTRLSNMMANINKINSAYKLIFSIFALSALIYIIRLIRQFGQKWTIHEIILHAFFILSIFVWLTNAPDPRFASGFLYVFIGYNLVLLFKWLKIDHQKLPINLAMVCLALLCWMNIVTNPFSKVNSNFSNSGFFPLSQAQYPIGNIELITIDQMPISLAKDLCWEAKLPCTYENIGFAPIGKNIEDGFKPISQNLEVK